MKEKKVGNQLWQTENANDLYFTNGDLIALSLNEVQWAINIFHKRPSVIQIEFNGKKETFYNHFAVNDTRGIGTNGFRVPNINDHDELINFIGGWDIVDRAKKIYDTLDLSASFNGNLDYTGNHIGQDFYGAWWLKLEHTKMPLFQSLFFCINANLLLEESHWRKQTYVNQGYQLTN
jgi:hypothetical protein